MNVKYIMTIKLGRISFKVILPFFGIHSNWEGINVRVLSRKSASRDKAHEGN